MKLSKLEMGVCLVLLFILAMELYLKHEEVFRSPELIFIGIALGFSIGFKLAALHGGTVSRKALDIAERHEIELSEFESHSIDVVSRLKTEIKRKDKLISSLNDALEDRDREVKQLVGELARLRKA